LGRVLAGTDELWRKFFRRKKNKVGSGDKFVVEVETSKAILLHILYSNSNIWFFLQKWRLKSFSVL
jgi:hypothetical protein